jgi:precorrin-2 dehydrogenase/sirohydrochlorin ferrochelatase/precorrin-6A/cobalt-precorrin-6A reductase
LTTGSKELEPFTLIENYKNRIFIRILPMPDSLNRVLDYGFRGSNVICMQGPFDTDMNIATLKMTGAKFLVTKDSGDIGGFEAKISAALSIGCEAIVISRPVREEGLTTEEILSVFGINESPSDIPGRTAYFPLFVDMRGKKVLIVGGGKIAERRIKALVSFGADVAVISPTVTEHIETAASQSSVQLVKKKYEYGDAARLNPFFVIAATSDRLVNQTVMKEAVSLNLLISVSDSREECSCYFPAIAENDAYIAGLVSKNGDHAGVKHMAEKIRELLNAWV